MGDRLPNSFRSYCAPRLSHVRGNDEARRQRRGGRACEARITPSSMIMFPDSTSGLNSSVLLGFGQIGGIAAEDAAIIRLRAVRVADPVDFPVDEVDASACTASWKRLKRGPSTPICPSARHGQRLSASGTRRTSRARPVARAGVKRILGGVVGHRVNVPGQDRVAGFAQQRPALAAAEAIRCPRRRDSAQRCRRSSPCGRCPSSSRYWPGSPPMTLQ